MFKISTVSTTASISYLPIVSINTQSNYNLPCFGLFVNSPSDIVYTTPINEITEADLDDLYTIDLSSTLMQSPTNIETNISNKIITSIEIGGAVYTLADVISPTISINNNISDDNPPPTSTSLIQPGEFIVENNVAIINLLPSAPTATTIKILTTNPDQLKTNSIYVSDDLKQIISKYGVTGITITEQFNGLPSASIQCKINGANYTELISYFNNTNKINLFNIYFRTASISLSDKSNIHVLEQYELTINLESWYKKILDTKVTIESNHFQSSNIKGYKKINIKSIAANEGLSISGGQVYKYVPEDTSESITIDLNSDINASLTNTGEYINYAQLTPCISSWRSGGLSHSLDNETIIGIKLDTTRTIRTQEVPPQYLTWLTDLDDLNSTDPPEQEGSEPPSYGYEPIPTYTITVPDPIDNPSASSHPEQDTIVTTLDMNFDVSGETKIIEKTTYYGNVVISKKIDTYGYAYTAFDMNRAGNGKYYRDWISPVDAWRKVSSVTTTYQFDDKTGYLIGEYTIGWRLARFKPETKNETITATKENNVTIITRSEDAHIYEFRKVPITGRKTYVLRSFFGIYNDLGNGEDRFLFWEEVDSKGRKTKKYKENPAYTEPFFVLEEQEYYNSFAWIVNPALAKSTEGEFAAPLTTGEIRNITKKTTILESKNTASSSYITGLQTNQGSKNLDDRYIVQTRYYTAEDGDFRNTFLQTSVETFSGRPPQHLYIPPNVKFDEVGNTVVPETPDIEKEVIDANKIIYTHPYNATDGIMGSQHYDVDSYTDALAAANTQLQINNTFSNLTFNISTYFDRSFTSGDTAIINWNNKKYTTRISSVSHNISIVDIDNIKGFTTINCGVINTDSYLTTSKKDKEGREDEEDGQNTDDTPLSMILPIDLNKTINENGVAMLKSFVGKMPTRGNF